MRFDVFGTAIEHGLHKSGERIPSSGGCWLWVRVAGGRGLVAPVAPPTPALIEVRGGKLLPQIDTLADFYQVIELKK